MNNNIVNENIDIKNNSIVKVNDTIIDTKPLKYIIINKPPNYVCANKDNENKCLSDIIPYGNLHYVGRLDKDTTGLVLMTNDLKLRKQLILPEFCHDKVYEFECLKDLTKDDILYFNNGIVIDGGIKCLPAKIELINNRHGYITIKEGKYHQIKKMFLSIDNKITRLHRKAIACIELGDLPEGSFRLLEDIEIQELQKLVKSR